MSNEATRGQADKQMNWSEIQIELMMGCRFGGGTGGMGGEGYGGGLNEAKNGALKQKQGC